MKNEKQSTRKPNKKVRSPKDIPLFDHDYIISRIFDTIFEMNSERTILTKKIRTSKQKNINPKIKKGKK
jgi:hypothetical protein